MNQVLRTVSVLLVIFIGSAMACQMASAQSPRPNILYFYVDDMGWGSIGPNGQAERRAQGLPSVRTPNLDRLAKRGLNFRRGYGCHVCSPARSSQQSGFHQGHTFADRNDPDNAKKAMRSDDILIGDALSAAGYATGYWGKWGYGGSKDQINPTIDNIQTLPTSHGYQYVLAELHHVRAHTFFQPTLWSAPASPGAIGGIELVPNTLSRYQQNDVYPSSPALQNDSRYPKTAYCDDSYAFAALDFVRRQGTIYNQSGQPFFGLLAVQIPHAPFGEIATLPDWDAAYADDPQFAGLSDQSRQWAAMVTRIDAHFGNILAALEDPNHDGDTSDSIADNTLVVFQSDNGGPSGKNNVELNANGGLRGVKGSIQEGGIRVPLVMCWPAMIHEESEMKAGTNTDRVVDVTDLLPTFCDLAGCEVPLGIDGVSIAPTLTGNAVQRHRDFIIHEAGNGQSIIRGNFKLVRTEQRGRGGPAFALYDLNADQTESTDISDQHPEMVNELKELLLGERVTEPRGFANTYHHWTGNDGAKTSDANNWSDYVYANAGVTYMTDDGAPRMSWTARIANRSNHPVTAVVDADMQCLALEIRGGASKDARQDVVVGTKVELTGRNEIRVADGGSLTLRDGTVSTVRWIDVQTGGSIQGNGAINGTVYNGGRVAAAVDPERRLEITSGFLQSDTGTLVVTVGNGNQVPLVVGGEANLAGNLVIKTDPSFKPEPGARVTVLSAKQVVGVFGNPDGEVIADDGIRFQIKYTNDTVTATVQ
ncbi:MAG: sulfatase-like hydrolase/transferase [Planctomycetales bacterium]|nr:sulfatase-like hydrolase/transferase [Planctomycetales bacterium]